MMKDVPYLLHSRRLAICAIALVAVSTLAALIFVSPTLPKDFNRAVGAAYDFAPLTFSGYEDFTDTTRPTPDTRTEIYPIQPDENALQIEQIAVTQFIASQLAVSVTVDNIETIPISGVVWFLLAPPNSPEPWTNAVYTAPEIPIELSAGTSETYQLTADDLPVGEFDLSVWIHTINGDDTRIHSDGQGFDEIIDVGNPYELAVEWDGSTLVTTAHSRLSKPSTFSLSITVNPNDDAAPWEVPPIERIVFDLTSGETLTRPFPMSGRTDESRVIVWLHELREDVFTLIASRALEIRS